MTHQQTKWLEAARYAGLAAALSVLPMGCKEEPPPTPPPPPPSGPVEPPTPTWEEISAVVPLDSKVEVRRADFVDTTREQMVALFEFLNALAAGEPDGLRPLLDSGARQVLDELVAEGEWERSISDVETVRLESASNVNDQVLATITLDSPGINDVRFRWRGRQRGDMFVFSADPDLPTFTPPSVESAAEDAAEDGAAPADSRDRERQPNDPRRFVPDSPGTNPGTG